MAEGKPPGRFSPRRWSVRRRIAAVSAGLTLLILLAFALVVGRLASSRMQSDFRDEVQGTANRLAIERLLGDPSNYFHKVVTAGDGVVRIVDPDGNAYPDTPPSPFGSPQPEVVEVGRYDVASQRIFTVGFGQTYYVQYARNRESVEATIDRLWLFLGCGVLGGTVLAAIAGVAVARRAMQPIASLTATAREIAHTRDPSRRVPMPESRDEVAELAETLDEMLRQLDAARSESEQMMQAQRDFVADASHELRTPLTSILANLELLEERLDESGDPEDAEIVDGALGSSRRMRRLVADLLLLAQADAGRSGPRRRCELNEIAAAAVSEVKPVAGDHRLVLDAGDGATVSGNPDDLHRLVLNLVDNGVRHTPAGCEVRVAVRADAGQALLEVSDDGPGLAPGLGDQIFGRFVRGDGPADVAVSSGTGLGLAIVKAVAVSHGGDVEVGASPAGGARFTVRLPLAERPEPALAGEVAG